MTDNRAIMEKAYDDFAKGDVPAFLATFSDKIGWFSAEGSPYWQGEPAVGPQQVVERIFMRIPQDYDGFAITINRLVGLGDPVVMEGRYTGAAKASGRPLDAQVAHVWDLKGGKALRFQQYINTAHVQQVLGAEVAPVAANSR